MRNTRYRRVLGEGVRACSKIIFLSWRIFSWRLEWKTCERVPHVHVRCARQCFWGAELGLSWGGL
eukprot:10715110-Alexandrium_andersonii.AAC.1